VALWALGFVRASVRARTGGCGSGISLTIQSWSTIAQLKHATSTLKEYLLNDRVHINNAQLGPDNAMVLGCITGSHPAFPIRDNMCEAIKNQMPIEYAKLEWALFPQSIYFTKASYGINCQLWVSPFK
jgi:hypothetical protein